MKIGLKTGYYKQAAHLNLDSHLSKEQYLKLMDIFRTEGANYVTFNIPFTECTECGHTMASPVTECPKCKSKKLKYWTRIIGYLTAVSSWSNERQKEFTKRIFSNDVEIH